MVLLTLLVATHEPPSSRGLCEEVWLGTAGFATTLLSQVMQRPADVPADRRIVNYNVRGRRGNIVQVYPSVEYDFVPQDLAKTIFNLSQPKCTCVFCLNWQPAFLHWIRASKL